MGTVNESFPGLVTMRTLSMISHRAEKGHRRALKSPLAVARSYGQIWFRTIASRTPALAICSLMVGATASTYCCDTCS